MIGDGRRIFRRRRRRRRLDLIARDVLGVGERRVAARVTLKVMPELDDRVQGGVLLGPSCFVQFPRTPA